MSLIRIGFALVCGLWMTAATAAPPPTAKQAYHETLHGTRIDDPYHWLEAATAPAVQAWIAAQNRYTESRLAAMPQARPLSARVKALAITSTRRSAPRLVNGTLFYLRQTPPQPQPVLVAQLWPKGAARVLVDPSADGGHTGLTGFWPSPDGRYLAYGTASGGNELTTLHVLDVRSGRRLPDTLPYAGGGTTPPGVAWDAHDRGFIYVRFPPPPHSPVRPFHAALAHHLLGQPAQRDRVVFGRGYSRVAEYRLRETATGGRLAVLANIGDGGAAEVYLRHGDGFRRVLKREANVREAAWVGQRLLVVSFRKAPRGRVLAVDGKGGVHTVLKQQAGVIQHIAPIAKGFLVVRSWGPRWWVEQYDGDGRQVRRLALPKQGIAIHGIAAQAGRKRALISYSGWTTATRWVEFDAGSGALSPIFTVKPAADYRAIEMHYIEGASSDGTRVPVTILAMKGARGHGPQPTILYGYGGFGIPVTPRFVGPYLAWLERGGVLAYANIRGGNEFGEAWHRGGMGTGKQRVFDDFHAAAQALLKTGWTDRRHLGILGGSNGGLLMGAQIVQHPADYRAVVSMVGIYDMIGHERRFANGAYNVSEYGSVRDPKVFRAVLAYSPLYQVKAKTAYPAVLMITGANDSRVAPWQSRKFAAALQAASDTQRPILLLTRQHAGHGVNASFSQRVGNTALALTFFAHELGLRMAP